MVGRGERRNGKPRCGALGGWACLAEPDRRGRRGRGVEKAGLTKGQFFAESFETFTLLRAKGPARAEAQSKCCQGVAQDSSPGEEHVSDESTL